MIVNATPELTAARDAATWGRDTDHIYTKHLKMANIVARRCKSGISLKLNAERETQ
jgi:hypothetical protein